MAEQYPSIGQNPQANPGFRSRVAQAHRSTAVAHDAALKHVRGKIDDKQGIWPVATPLLGLGVCGIGLYSTCSSIANFKDIKSPSKEEKNEKVVNWVFLSVYIIITIYFLWRFGSGVKDIHHGNKGAAHEIEM